MQQRKVQKTVRKFLQPAESAINYSLRHGNTITVGDRTYRGRTPEYKIITHVTKDGTPFLGGRLQRLVTPGLRPVRPYALKVTKGVPYVRTA